MNRITLTVIILLIIGVIGYFWVTDWSQPKHFEDSERPLPLGMEPATGGAASGSSVRTGSADEEDLLPHDISTILDPSKSVPLDTIPESLTVLVNRAFLLPEDYVPLSLTMPKIPFDTTVISEKNNLRSEAATQIEKLFKDAKKKKIKLTGVSGYRSYARQKAVFEQSAIDHGREHADKYCALPGSSEHQTGLAIDVSSPEIGNVLEVGFADTKAGKWIEDNSYKYGFVVRYPKGKQKITGYNYEPWHLRYVGLDTAAYLYENKLTLEEFYNVSMNKENKDWRNDL
ncbi:MAG: M15 family metallopeptidase [Eubacterium sp.]|nr:M15 family metallopeptidase [Eubacterium sp.]